MNDGNHLLALLIFVAALAGCRTLPTQGTSPGLLPSLPATSPTIGASTATPVRSTALLATPVAAQPAAGICGQYVGPVVTITIYLDIPDPRCAIIQPAQLLSVVNRREDRIRVSLAGAEAAIDPGRDYSFDTQLGQLLVMGVHPLKVDPCCSAELWLQ